MHVWSGANPSNIVHVWSGSNPRNIMHVWSGFNPSTIVHVWSGFNPSNIMHVWSGANPSNIVHVWSGSNPSNIMHPSIAESLQIRVLKHQGMCIGSKAGGEEWHSLRSGGRIHGAENERCTSLCF
jgi:hypothetical protein